MTGYYYTTIEASVITVKGLDEQEIEKKNNKKKKKPVPNNNNIINIENNIIPPMIGENEENIAKDDNKEN